MGTDAKSAGDFTQWLKDTRSALPNSGETNVPCGTCEGCCRSSYFILIRPDEKETLARVPKALQFPAPGLPEGHVVMGYDEAGRCPMITDSGCAIYEHRPRTCRAYDCRVFTATGLMPGGDEKRLIGDSVAQWSFDYADEPSRALHRSLKAVAAFLSDRRDRLPPGVIPQNPLQLAVLAIRGHDVLQPLLDGDGDPPIDALVQALAEVSWQGDLERRGGGSG